MKLRYKSKYFKWGFTVVIVFCTCLMFYYLLFHGAQFKAAVGTITNVLLPLFFGGIMAYLLTPTLNWLEIKILLPIVELLKVKKIDKAHKFVRLLGIVLTALIYYFIIQLLISMVLSQIIPSLEALVSNYETYVKNFLMWLNSVFAEYPEIKDYIINLVDRYTMEVVTFVNDTILTKSSELIKTISLSILNILGVLWDFILGFVIAIYLLASKEKFANQAKKILYACMNRERANVFINNCRFSHNTFIGFITGKVVDSIIIGLLCFIGTSLLQTPYAVLVSVIIGVTNVIPFFGPFLGAIPCIILVFVVDPMHPLNVVYFALFVFALQQLDGNVIGPKILGDSTGLSSFWVIFAITLFGGILGIPGMIIGVPLFAIIHAAIKSYVNEALIKKKLSSKTENYADVECIDPEGKVYYYDFINDAKSKEFHSGSMYISSVDEWKYRYRRKLEEEAEAAKKDVIEGAIDATKEDKDGKAE